MRTSVRHEVSRVNTVVPSSQHCLLNTNSSAQQMDLYSLRIPEHHLDMYPFHHDIAGISSVQAVSVIPSKTSSSCQYGTIGFDVLWVCGAYKSLPADKYCWNISADQNHDNSLHYPHSDILL